MEMIQHHEHGSRYLTVRPVVSVRPAKLHTCARCRALVRRGERECPACRAKRERREQ
jgi:hypothetical protein